MRYKFISHAVSAAKNTAGFTLIESLVGIAVFAILSTAVYFAYSNIASITLQLKLRSAAISLINNEIEIIRNIPYENVGIQGGFPVGELLAEQTISYDNISFLLNTTIRNIDDPFDGTLGGNPNDTAPADYKLVELEINAPSYPNFLPIKLTTSVAPQGLENATNNGALFINVFNAFGQPVSNANVSVINNQLNPTISITDTTNANGVLQLVDIPTSTNAYEIKVTKNSYSSEQTYPLGGSSNPNPITSHATVASQQVTNTSFAIDKVSTINLKTRDAMCQPISNIKFLQEGTKLIGRNPDILKYSSSSTTDQNGEKNINNLEWDTYNFSNLDENYDLSGFSSLLSIILNPDSTAEISWLMELKNPSALLVTVQDSNGQLINDAAVKLNKIDFDQTFDSGRRFFSQTDWSAGQYSSQSGNIETNDPSGEIKLKLIDGQYPTSTPNWIISPTFDLGTQNTNFYNLSWQPVNQPSETGPESLTFQIAANNDNTTWNFVGPDGTPNTFYSLSDSQIYSGHNNNRYLQYQVFLKTENENYTPRLEEVKIEFRSSCLPDGQVFFNGLENGVYALTVQKSGYQNFTNSSLSIDSNWQEYKVILQNL